MNGLPFFTVDHADMQEERKITVITIDGDHYHCCADPELLPAIERQLGGKTTADQEIASLGIPNRPLSLRLAISLIRSYQKRISPKLGSRCVYEPSCSHYAELALRKYGLKKGVAKTIKRLLRCRPPNGGHDLP